MKRFLSVLLCLATVLAGFSLSVAAESVQSALSDAELDLSDYDVDRYTQYYWDDSGVITLESFFPLKNADGTIDPIQLTHSIARVISVRSATLDVKYTEGVDYTVADGKLVILPDGSIPQYNHSLVYSATGKANGWRQCLDGSYAFCGQQSLYFTGYLNVTYTYDPETDPWDGPVPEAKGDRLDKIVTKLENGDAVKILTVGDSIAGGANCSKEINVAPYADIWWEMAAQTLQTRYPDAAISYTSIDQGGASAQLCVDRMADILKEAPDLIMIEFGTNECMAGDPASEYVETLQTAIAAIQENLPECDIMLVSPIISNPIFFPTQWFHNYVDALYTLEDTGIAVADVTSMMRYLIHQKGYLNMTGDYLCHPNDFISRLYAQVVLATLERGNERDTYGVRLANYRYAEDYYAEQWEEIEALVAEGQAAIAAAADSDAARGALLSYQEKIRAIPTMEQMLAASSLDLTNLIFNSTRSRDAISARYNIDDRYDPDASALIGTVSMNRNPALTLDYTCGDVPVVADNYTHAILTIRVESTRAKQSGITFVTGQTVGTKMFDLIADGKYHSYIVDLSDEANWTGTVKQASLICFDNRNCANGDRIYYSSIILCSGAKDATDIAIEREVAANKNAGSAVTTLFDRDAVAESLGSLSYVRGDLDGDGEVLAWDAYLLRRLLAGCDVSISNTDGIDVDGDGEINAVDALVLAQILFGVAEPETVTTDYAKVSYDAAQDAAKIELLEDNAVLQMDISALQCAGDVYKYVALCAKSADGAPVRMSVTVRSPKISDTAEVELEGDTLFTAGSVCLPALTDNLQTILFTFHAPAGTVIYFDSFVFTSTAAASRNAEAVRIGAANLI